MEHIVVIGAGVIGLSSGVYLLQSGYKVTIIARDFPSPFETADPKHFINYSSLWAGAHNRWVLPTNATEQRDHAMALSTYRHMEQLVSLHPECGVHFTKGIEYLEDVPQVYKDLTAETASGLGITDFRLYTNEELPDKVTWGCEYQTWCANPMVYCLFLLRQFALLGGRTVNMELRTPLEVRDMKAFSDVRTVVNCSGVGFNDPDVFPTRGQTCVVANNCPATVTRQNGDGSWTFCVPRGFNGGTVIGGTKEPNNWDTEPSEEVRRRLLDALARTYPSIRDEEDFRVVRDIVGRRPTRKGGIRLEKEQHDERFSVIHAYGLGGRGYELSWGVAEQVARLLK
ncbi:FAD dependent oxidoreductase superfamily protein [Pochonia chlamydosporia 170]|uniref:FAD dependent oxidoreductase superfamily protein n=1 Tax=Pochonia chlamydosporia 170 TaxID=1380566 RepID=A0A179FBJ2_METCM|nr:FAD dependent oxidoreductase superfamily protein [Pochonia chlamydosporia 170]OAQ62834.1 FAD dependent oxidoreductase superfamily protein [Pochonia chlamydosporia 170]